MWSTFYMQKEEGRSGGGMSGLEGMMGTRTGTGKRRHAGISESQEGQIKVLILVAIVGAALTVLGVGTEFWVELAPPKTFSSNETCLMAHTGLWKGCLRTLWAADIDPDRESCGPANLPGESNCTNFKLFSSGDDVVMFKKTPQKSLSRAAAILALLSLFMIVTAAVCVTMSLGKRELFFLKPASVCFIFSGLLILISLIIFHQSVLSFLASDHSVPLHHEFSWSVTCVGIGGGILILAGALFLLLTLPYSLWERCLPENHSAT